MLESNHKRILRNTGMLYIRMLLAMVVGLYTTRVLLNVLGVEDFGIYFVVAGFVALLGFMQGALTTATQRYFAFDLGQNSGHNLRGLFNTSLQVHALLAVCIVMLAETAGYWFVSTRLNIPEGRLVAALLAYHLSVASFAVTVMTVPLTAMLMANERMGLFALMSMADLLLKLAAVLLLPYLVYDHLSMYAALLLVVSLLTLSGYLLINRAIFPGVRLQRGFDKKSFHSMLGFTAWNTWGNLAAALSEHGNNVLLNIFFGPAVNAGRSIATQANGALNQFVTNVQAAINPQIVKLYASGEREQMHKLALRAAKYNFFILLVLAMPVLLNPDKLLRLWLVEVPPYAAVFLQLTIVASLINSVSGPLMTSAQATGHIRLYHSVVGGILLLNVPLNYLLLSCGLPPETLLAVTIALAVVALVARLYIITPLIGLPVGLFLSRVVGKATLVALVAGIFAILTQAASSGSLLILFSNLITAMAVTLIAIWMLGLDKSERQYIVSLLKSLKARTPLI
ncbi:MATE family efflux transporter [Pseudomonas sp. FIP_A4]|uniref:MATE family efflux transporter n=1 Tax=Pseudomonas sp. FIP_A4 TaxID=3070684 RepID=UPI002FD6CD0B